MKDELFFYRIDVVDLMDFATEPEGMNMTLLAFAKELKKGTSDHVGIQKMMDKTYNYLEKKRKAGSSGGIAKASSAKAKASSAKVCSSKSYLETEAVTEAVTIPKVKTLCPTKVVHTTGFESFWLAYPKKIGKGAAEKVWNKLKPCSSLQQKMAIALESQCRSVQWQREGGQYIPNPATWLNQKRWEDDLTEPEYKSEQTLRREKRFQEVSF